MGAESSDEGTLDFHFKAAGALNGSLQLQVSLP